MNNKLVVFDANMNDNSNRESIKREFRDSTFFNASAAELSYENTNQTYYMCYEKTTLIYKKVDGSRIFGIVIDDYVLRYIGYYVLDENLDYLPENVFAIGRKGDILTDDLKSPYNVFRKEYILHFLDSTLKQTIQKRPTAIKIPDFEEKCMILFHDYLSIIQENKDDIPFPVFIGSLKDQCNHLGIKMSSLQMLEGFFSDGSESKKEEHASYSRVISSKFTYTGRIQENKPNGFGCSISNERPQYFYGIFKNGSHFFGTRVITGDQALSLWNVENRTVTIELFKNLQHNIGYIRNHRKEHISLVEAVSGATVSSKLICDKRKLVFSLASNATLYFGQTVDNVYKGYGEMHYRNQSYYQGDWSHTQYNGFGLLVIKIAPPRISNTKYFLRNWSHLGSSESIYPLENRPASKRNNEYDLNNLRTLKERKNAISKLIEYFIKPKLISNTTELSGYLGVPASEANEEQELE